MIPRLYGSPRLSPDGTKIVVQTREQEAGQGKIWVYDLSVDGPMQLLAQEGNNQLPIWHPDGERIAFTSDRVEKPSIYLQRADGSGVAERLTTAQEGRHIAESWTPDGATLSFSITLTGSDWNLYTLSLDDGAEPQVISATPGAIEAHSSFSPDGKWIAYYSDRDRTTANGRIIVAPFPGTGIAYEIPQMSAHAIWAPNQEELFYIKGARDSLYSVAITTGAAVAFGTEQSLAMEGLLMFAIYRDHDIMPDGERFVVVLPAEVGDEGPPRINIVLNWIEELKERVPVP